MGVTIRIRTKGIDKLIEKVGKRSASLLEDKVDVELHVGVQRMATTAYRNAPVETGALRSSIIRSVRSDGHLEYIFGSYMPYAQRQEYEHKTKKQYMHRAVWTHQPQLKKDLERLIQRHFE